MANAATAITAALRPIAASDIAIQRVPRPERGTAGIRQQRRLQPPREQLHGPWSAPAARRRQP